MRVPGHIVFGGTFDPPHQGHIDCVDLARQAFPRAKISIVPSPSPAGAAKRHKQPVASYRDRKVMVTMAMGALLSDRITINEIETTLPKPNYSLQTLNALRQQAPEESLALLMGEDQLASFASWRQPVAILEIADVLVARRQGHVYLATEPWQKLARDLGLSFEPREFGAYVPQTDAYFWVAEGRISDASSTVIRATLDAQKPVPKAWMPRKLVNWIIDRKLYSSVS